MGVNQEKIDAAIEKINNITFKPTVGEIYNVTVVKILDFGAVVEFVPGNEVCSWQISKTSLNMTCKYWRRTQFWILKNSGTTSNKRLLL